ncbi:MAG: cysteinyl-tRNA synthetase [Anaerolineae bacterium]|nr:MAG: cysteinyl-tRNA synthetase [Anaerolineae bacterium]
MPTTSSFGKIAFLGSGETSLAGGRIFERLAAELPPPLRIAVLETPAGFELNSAQVAGRVADFLRKRLQNYRPTVDVIPARKRGTPFSPDDPDILRPLLRANLIFMGPGSPTYAVRQLRGSLAWEMLRARHRLGAALVFSSAAAIAVGAHVLPVYEIYKVGEDVHVKPGLDFFADFGLALSMVSHWNNAEGGIDLDTSRCFVGRERFEAWLSLLPPERVVLGLDEHTGLILDPQSGKCTVHGVSSVTLLLPDETRIFPAGEQFPVTLLGDFRLPDPLHAGLRAEVWERVRSAPDPESAEARPPAEVLALVEERERARAARDWPRADALRERIADLGWQVQDTPEGPRLTKR